MVMTGLTRSAIFTCIDSSSIGVFIEVFLLNAEAEVLTLGNTEAEEKDERAEGNVQLIEGMARP
jgi:hypothetical protein